MLDRDRVRLTWDAPEDYPTGVSGYRVYRKDVTDPQTSMRFGWEEDPGTPHRRHGDHVR